MCATMQFSIGPQKLIDMTVAAALQKANIKEQILTWGGIGLAGFETGSQMQQASPPPLQQIVKGRQIGVVPGL